MIVGFIAGYKFFVGELLARELRDQVVESDISISVFLHDYIVVPGCGSSKCQRP